MSFTPGLCFINTQYSFSLILQQRSSCVLHTDYVLPPWVPVMINPTGCFVCFFSVINTHPRWRGSVFRPNSKPNCLSLFLHSVCGACQSQCTTVHTITHTPHHKLIIIQILNCTHADPFQNKAFKSVRWLQMMHKNVLLSWLLLILLIFFSFGFYFLQVLTNGWTISK